MENKQQLRPHLTKEHRLPKCFKEVEKILRSVKSCQQNYKTILANSRLRGHIHKKVYSMTVNVLKYYSYIQKIIDKIQLLEKEQYLRREIASILIYELIFGNGFLPGESKVVKTIQKYENDVFHAHEVLQNETESNLIIEINIPRYVRVHTLVTTVPYVIKDLISYGFHQVIYDGEVSEEKYLELVKNLNKGSFLIDFHFKDVLVFEHHENLVSLDLYKNGHIFLQDKSSYIPVHVLNPQPGCAVLDACAAPGMKTVHIAAKMKNTGILIASERDKSRFECLKEMLVCGSVKICKTLCKDFKLIDPSDQAYSTIEYILLDPSCSGSGMVNRLDEVTDTENSKNMERLMKLAGFQIILLKHSLKFPAVKRVVYSTCSVHEEENEYVVHEALKAFSGTFKLIPAMPEWSHRGSEKFEFGKFCLRTDPKVHLTNGFFVAVFERINYDEYAGECQENYQSSSFREQKRMSSKFKESCGRTAEYCVQVKENENITLLHTNSESSSQATDYKLEHNIDYAQQTHKNKKQKKKEKQNGCFSESDVLNLETSHESLLKCSNDINGNANMSKDKSELSDHQSKCNLHENIKAIEELIDVKKLHKKKKKKKREYFEIEMVQSSEFSQENNISKQDDNNLQPELDGDNADFTSKYVSAENKNISNIDCEDSVEFIGMTSSRKKKKKRKEHLSMNYNQSSDKVKQNDTSVLCKLNDSNISVSNEIPGKISDSTLSHRKKNKKKLEQNLDYVQQIHKKQKKKKKENLNDCSDEVKLETSDESPLECFNNKNSNTHMKKNESKYSDNHSKQNLLESIEAIEELTDVKKLHKKKKKKKKEYFEILQSGEFHQEKQNISSEQKQNVSKQDDSHLQLQLNDANFTNKYLSAQNKNMNNMECEDLEEFMSVPSSHKKKKKKKEPLNMDYN